MKEVYIKNRVEWRKWLFRNHNKNSGIWLVFYKKKTDKPALAYETAVEEALCFGWIDSIIKKIDDSKYARKFTPRKNQSKWSQINKKRASKMIEEGRMTKTGISRIEFAKQTGQWDQNAGPNIDFNISPEFAAALNKNHRANENFETLAPTYRRQYTGWINTAKRPETKKKRIAESIALLQNGEKLGLK
jgi:uncharacterized protein YdeI (YjbR/CyaY-like superfamily)